MLPQQQYGQTLMLLLGDFWDILAMSGIMIMLLSLPGGRLAAP